MPLRIAVLSDLHVFEGSSDSPKAPSYIGTHDPQNVPEKHPFAGLWSLIDRERLTADLVVCPGDMTDRANPGSLQFAWGQLQILKERLGASHLLVTNGNHDLDSRFAHSDFDAKGALQALVPMFPGLGEAECDRYWARNFVVTEAAGARVVLLNSAAFHGYGKDQAAEFERGRISEATLLALRNALQGPSGPVNILVCHHHPMRFNAIDEKDYSEMLGGDGLLSLLGSGEFGQWLVIHGHKHFPALTYAPGTVGSPVILSAGSFSVALHQRLAHRASNQFYLVELATEDYDVLSLDIAGTVRAWDWINMVGWQAAGPRSGLPHRSGFGWRESITGLSLGIADHTPATGEVITREALYAAMPRLKYVLPDDLQTALRRLEAVHGIATTVNDGELIELGRKA